MISLKGGGVVADNKLRGTSDFAVPCPNPIITVEYHLRVIMHAACMHPLMRVVGIIHVMYTDQSYSSPTDWCLNHGNRSS